MLTALGSIAKQQANPTENTIQKVKQLLDYATTHPDAIFHSIPATWYLLATEMPSTSSNKNKEGEQEAIFHVQQFS